MSNKTTAVLESLRNLKVWLEKEGIVADECDDAIARLAELEAENKLLKKAHYAYEVYVRANLGKDAEYFGDEVYQHVMRGGQYSGEEVNCYNPIEDALPDYNALQHKEPNDEATER